MDQKIKYAIILAGGKGERLRPLTNDRPKPMVEVCGKPILLYQIERLKAVGVEEVVIACSYLWEKIQEFFEDGHKFGVKISYSVERSPLGRGGAIKQAMKQLPNGWQEAIVLNGDNLSTVDLLSLAQRHLSNKAIATIVVVPLKSPYGIVEFNQKKQILGFREKPILPHWINAGIYVFSSEIESMLPEVGDHETETFPMLPKEHFFVFESTSYWRGVDTVKDLTEAEKEVKEVFELATAS